MEHISKFVEQYMELVGSRSSPTVDDNDAFSRNVCAISGIKEPAVSPSRSGNPLTSAPLFAPFVANGEEGFTCTTVEPLQDGQQSLSRGSESSPALTWSTMNRKRLP